MYISASKINANSLQDFIFIFSILIFLMNRNDHNQCNIEGVWKLFDVKKGLIFVDICASHCTKLALVIYQPKI